MLGSANRPSQPKEKPHITYQAVIQKLRSRQNPQNQSDLEKQCVILALLILLAGSIIDGSSDFRVILRLIETFRLAVNNDGIFTKGELGHFLSTQIEKYDIDLGDPSIP